MSQTTNISPHHSNDFESDPDSERQAESVRDIRANINEDAHDDDITQELEKHLSQVLADSHENILPIRKLLVVFAGLSLSLLFSFIDQTSITVALPHIADDLHAQETISWAGTASFISNTVFTVLFGRFSDIFSRKYTLVASLLILTFSDLACALSQTAYQLYIFRAFAGIGNGGVTSLAMMITSDIVTLRDRGKYQGVLGSCVGIGNAIGPFLSSAFITHETWRKLYYMLFPIGIAACGIIIWLVPYTHHSSNIKEKLLALDYLGFFFSAVGIIFVLIPLSGGGSTYQWDSAFSISFFIIGGLSIVIFLIIEKKYAKLPIIPLKLFTTNVSLTLLLLQNFFYGMCYYSCVYYFPYYFQRIRGKTILMSSEYMLALVLPQSCISIATGQIISRVRHYVHVIWFGYICWVIGTGLLLLWDVDTTNVRIVFAMLMIGTGVGATFQPSLVAAQAQSYKKDRAIVISTRNFLRSFGGAIGLAVSNTMLSNAYIKKLDQYGDNYFTSAELGVLKSQIFTTTNFSSYKINQATFLETILMESLRTLFYFWLALIALCLLSLVTLRDSGLDPIDVHQEAELRDREKMVDHTDTSSAIENTISVAPK